MADSRGPVQSAVLDQKNLVYLYMEDRYQANSRNQCLDAFLQFDEKAPRPG